MNARWWLVAAAVAATAPLYVPDSYLFTLALMLVTALALLGLSYIIANSGLVSVGHAAIQGIGAYAAAICATRLHAPWPLALVAAVAAAALVGLIVAIPSVRLTGPYFAVVTLALGWAVPQFLTVAAPLTGGYGGVYVDSLRIAGTSTATMYWLALLLVALAIWMQSNLDRSHFGAALMLQKTSVHAARSLGIDTTAAKVLAVSFGNGLAGLSGALVLYLVSQISPATFSFTQSALFLAGSIIGGVSSPAGALLGAAVVVLAPQLLAGSAAWGGVMLGALLLGMLILRPNGIVSLVRPESRMKRRGPAPILVDEAKP